MLEQLDTHPTGTYHVRVASMRASWFPDVARRVLDEIPDGVDAILDLSDIESVDRFSVSALGAAANDASQRGVTLAISARVPAVRAALLREGVDQWASIASDMTSARRLLGLLDQA